MNRTNNINNKTYMKRSSDLQRELRRLDHKSYGMYKGLKGSYDYGEFILHIDHVQGDPFATPSRMRVEVSQKIHGFPKEYYETNVVTNPEKRTESNLVKANPEKRTESNLVKASPGNRTESNLVKANIRVRRITLEDQVLRKFRRELAHLARTVNGSGKSGRITTCPTGQKVLERIAVIYNHKSMELRFEMGFPARGRTILADEMEKLLFDIIPALVQSSLIYKNWSVREKSSLREAIFLRDDQYAIRQELVRRNLVAFIADGSILPRENGISDLPMKEAITFASSETMRVELTLPHKGRITGMGIPEGVTTIVGGGYHGKSTLLKALEQGVYDHIAGDGREYVITRDCASKIRAEDGRNVNHTDISLFINHLPTGQNTTDFSTENASGSTSQAANLIEALESGSNLLLIDEDTSATNFMIRDAVMGELVSDDQEPITPLIRKIRSLYEQKGISFIIVVGSSGDYLGVSDHVIQMDRYQVRDVTEKAKKIAAKYFSASENVNDLRADILTQDSMAQDNMAQDNVDRTRILLPKRFPDRIKLKTVGTDTIMIDREVIDIRYLEQLCDSGQSICLGYILLWILQENNKPKPLGQIIEEVYHKIDEEGLIALIPDHYPGGHPVRPRRQELYSSINRYRSLKIKQDC